MFIELNGVVDEQAILKHIDKFQIIGIERDEPIVQIGPYTFIGKLQESVGTDLYFEKSTAAARAQQPFASGKKTVKLQYFGKSTKRLCMNRAAVIPKQSQPNKDDASDSAGADHSADAN